MAENKKSLINVDLNSPVSFKAEIKTEIPKESSGRLLDALTDMIRPFTESRGLKADQIRLQREEVLIEIAKRVRENSRIEGSELKTIPNKFMVPFLEKASLEEKDSALLGTWSNLLHSAATDYDTAMVRYTSVLSEIGPKEIEFLERLIMGCRSWHVSTQMPDIPIIFTQTNMMSFFRNEPENEAGDAGVAADFIVEHEYPGALVKEVSLFNEENQTVISHPKISRDDDSVIAVLGSLGILRDDVLQFQEGDWFVWIEGISLTSFGISFVMACSQMLKDDIRNIESQQDKKQKLDFPDVWRRKGGYKRILKAAQEF